MVECQIISKLWDSWQDEIKQRYDIDIEITKERIILNDFVTRPGHIINLLGLIPKQLIYRKKCEGKLLTFNHYLNEIALVENIEKYNATIANKVMYHDMKWQKITIAVTSLYM